MNDTNRPLNDDDVRQIAQLMESLENSDMEYLQVELGNLKVTIGKGDPPNQIPSSPSATVTSSPSPAAPSDPIPPNTGVEENTVSTGIKTDAENGTVIITAPMLGRYYAQSEPGADPFVELGDEVDKDTTVALIEVMKMFTAVPAGADGVISEIFAQNEEIVEFGQNLFRVRIK